MVAIAEDHTGDLQRIVDRLRELKCIESSSGQDRAQWLAVHDDMAGEIKKLLWDAVPIIGNLEAKILASASPHERIRIRNLIVQMGHAQTESPSTAMEAALQAGSVVYLKGAIDMLLLILSLLRP